VLNTFKMLVRLGNSRNLASQKNLLHILLTKKKKFFHTQFSVETIENLPISANKNLICFFIFGKDSTFGRFFKLLCASCSQIEGKNENLKQ
jgi:hypothetical protein